MKIKYLPLLLMVFVTFQSAGCGQTDVRSQSNETKPASSKEVEVPSAVKKADYEADPPQGSLLLTLNKDKQVYYQDKLINDSALRDVLKTAAAKTKKPPKTTMPSYTLADAKVNRIYLKADAGLPFSEVVKILKMVRESSPNEYRAKLVINPSEEVGNYEKTANGRYVMSFDLGLPADPGGFPRPDPLTLVAALDTAGKIKLNNEPPMQISELKTLLLRIFKDRETSGIFVEGTNEIVRKVILTAGPDVKYGDVIKLIDELYGIDANPVIFGDLSGEHLPSPIEILRPPTPKKPSVGKGIGNGGWPKP